MSLAIIDYGSGNLHSAAKALERAARDSGLGTPVLVTADPNVLRRAERLVLPGVGAFKDCREGLRAVPGLWETLEEQVIAKGKPFLGICVGMQLMASRGLEHDVTEGFGWIPGDVMRISPPILPSRSRTWAGTRSTSAGPMPCWTGSRSANRGFTPTSSTPTIWCRATHPTSSPRRNMAVRSRLSWAGTTWPEPSSIQRKANNWGSGSSQIF